MSNHLSVKAILLHHHQVAMGKMRSMMRQTRRQFAFEQDRDIKRTLWEQEQLVAYGFYFLWLLLDIGIVVSWTRYLVR